MQKLAFDHAIEQGLRPLEIVVTIALLSSDECSLPFDPSIAVSDMAINTGKQF